MRQERFNKPKAFRFKCFAGKAYSAFNSLHREVTIGVVTSCVLTFAAAGTVAAQTNVIAGVESAEMEHEPDDGIITDLLLDMPMRQVACLTTIIRQDAVAQSPVQNISQLLAYKSDIFFSLPFFYPTTSFFMPVFFPSGQLFFNGFHLFLTPPASLFDIGLGLFRRLCCVFYPTDHFLSSNLNRIK